MANIIKRLNRELGVDNYTIENSPVIKGNETIPEFDIWSFGVILYQLMSFDLPYGGGGKGKSHNMANIIQNNPRLPITKNYSIRLKWLVDRITSNIS